MVFIFNIDGALLIWQLSDKKSLALGETDEDMLEYWRVSAVLRGTNGDIYDISWSPDGSLLAAASVDSSVRIFSIKDQKCIHVLVDHNHFCQGISWDPLFVYLASQSSDR